MRIESVSIRDFCGIQNVDLQLAGLTLLYGVNGAGKSSVLDAIRHALTGDLRGEIVADVIRQGAKKATVEVMFGERTGVATVTTPRGRSVSVDGVEIPTKEAPAAIATTTGASVEAIRAALASGAILSMKPDARLALLAAITGAKFDKATIAGELAGVDLLGNDSPSSLTELRLLADRAVAARKEAKRRKDDAEQDYAHVPLVAPAIAAKATNEADVIARLAELRRRRDVSLIQANPARLAELDAEIAKHGPSKLPSVSPAAAGERMVRAEAALKDALRLVADLEARAVPAAGPSLDDATRAVDLARAEAAAARKALDLARAEYGRRAAIVEAVKDGGCCDTCGQALTDALLGTAKDALDTAKSEGKAKADADAAAQARLAQAEQALLSARHTEAARKAAADLVIAKKAVPEAEAAFVKATDEYRKLREAAATADAHNARIDERARLLTPSADNVTLLEAEILELEAVWTAFRPLADAARLKKSIADAEARVIAADQLEKRCLEARASIVSKAIAPFTKAANDALALIAPGLTVEVDGEVSITVGRLSIDRLSDGERMRVLYALQLAVTRLAGVRLLVLDRVEVVDDVGRGALKKLAAACADEGIQVVMLTCATAPSVLPPAVRGYVIQGGRAVAIPAAKAA